MTSTIKWLAAACAAVAATGACRDQRRVPAEEAATTPAPVVREDTTADADRWLEDRVYERLADELVLSRMARAVEIEASRGVVTLRGPVASDAERADVERLAIEIAGEGNVRNRLSIAPPEPTGGAPAAPGAAGGATTVIVIGGGAQGATGGAPAEPTRDTSTGPIIGRGLTGGPTAGTVDTGGLPATRFDAAPANVPGPYGLYPGTVLVVPEELAQPATPTPPAGQGTPPGLTMPGEANTPSGTPGLVPGTTAPSSSGISPGSVQPTPSTSGTTGTP
jgi:hypothetical protein